MSSEPDMGVECRHHEKTKKRESVKGEDEEKGKDDEDVIISSVLGEDPSRQPPHARTILPP